MRKVCYVIIYHVKALLLEKN